MLQEKLQKKLLNKKIILLASLALVISHLVIYYLINARLNNKVKFVQQEHQISIEQLNNKLLKTNKQLHLAKEENKHLQTVNQSLEKQLQEAHVLKQDIEYEIMQLKNNSLALTKDHQDHMQKINSLNKHNNELQELIKELRLQIKNHKDNTYNLFQAGKLEVELANVEQQLSEQYDNMLQKKHNIVYLKDKCGALRINKHVCKEYDLAVSNLSFLEQQVVLLTNKKEDLKQRINAYLASSK